MDSDSESLAKAICATKPSGGIFDLTDFANDVNSARIKIKMRKSDTPEWFQVTRKALIDGAVYHAT